MHQKVVLQFQARGETIPVDHGFLLYSALSRVAPALHNSREAGVKLLRGKYRGQGELDISAGALLQILAPEAEIAELLQLAGAAIELAGTLITLGPPRTLPLEPRPALYAHIVTTRNGHDENAFTAEIARQLDAMPVRCSWRLGKRRT